MYQPKTISAKEMIPDGDYPVYGANGLIGRYSQFNHAEPQLLITCRGATCGSVNISAPKSWITGNAMVVRPKTGSLNIRFLEYLFRGGLDIAAAITGSAQPQITRTNLNPIVLHYPEDTKEQERIVAILDEAFEGIDTAVANAEKNLANARELFEGYLDSALAQKDEGWTERPLGECFRLKSGDGLTSKAMVDGPFPVFGGNGIAGMHNEFNLFGDNVIVGRVGALCGNARFVTDKIWLTDNAFRVVDYSQEFDGSFLTFLLNRLNLRSLARQSAQPVISNSSLKDLLLVFPISLTEQRRIAANIETVFAETRRLEVAYQQKLSNFVELKQAILHKAFAGELSAPSARAVQEAAE